MRVEGAGARPDVSEVLAQMRLLKQAAQSRIEPDVGAVGLRAPGPSDVQSAGAATSPVQTFGAHLSSALKNVTELQNESSRLTEGLARGTHNDLVATMIASQKSSVAFQAATQVRNRLVTAYESIMNMPI